MSLSARIGLEPSVVVARATMLMPMGGVVVAAMTLVARWPMHRTGFLCAGVVACALIAAFGLHRLGCLRRSHLGLTLSARSDIDIVASDPSHDGSASLAESTVVWPAFWMLALHPVGARVIHWPLLPGGLRAEVRWPLARYLGWSMRARDGRSGEKVDR